MKPRFDINDEVCDPLSIMALCGSPAMLRKMLMNADFDDGNFLPSTVMTSVDQVLHWGDLSRLCILFREGRPDRRPDYKPVFELILSYWVETRMRDRDWGIFFELVDDVLHQLVTDR